jgi:lipoprotein NlpD
MANLVILKHNNTYLTAYAHNQTLLVKEDQSVQKGQRIAEMGSSDADRVKLHFEIRKTKASQWILPNYCPLVHE